MKKFLIVIFIHLFITNFCYAEVVINFLPDGTEVKIQDNIVYAVCNGKFKIISNGSYMLADGSTMTVKDGKLVSSYKSRKWQDYPDK